MVCYNFITYHFAYETEKVMEGLSNVSENGCSDDTRAMYDFLLYHTYSHLSGLIGAIFGVLYLDLESGRWHKEIIPQV